MGVTQFALFYVMAVLSVALAFYLSTKLAVMAFAEVVPVALHVNELPTAVRMKIIGRWLLVENVNANVCSGKSLGKISQETDRLDHFLTELLSGHAGF